MYFSSTTVFAVTQNALRCMPDSPLDYVREVADIQSRIAVKCNEIRPSEREFYGYELFSRCLDILVSTETE